MNELMKFTPQRKARAELDFRFFCESYLPETFYFGWSVNQLLLIDKFEKAVLRNELSAIALPIGEGKSSISIAAALWAALYGHHKYIALIVANISCGLDCIKNEIESNNWLAADFPEACSPITELERITTRCAGQMYNGERTRITWANNEIVLPSIKGSKSSGVVIRATKITGRIRGMKCKRSDGVVIRPSLVIIDAPQTAESASSLEQTCKRMAIINGDVLGLAGSGKKIAGVMPCTIIKPGDLADQILDTKKYPEWNGIRTKMMISFPKNTALWDLYANIRAESLREHGDIRDATEFYRKNRDAMDEGASVSWESRYNNDEISAIQNAMNLKIQDEDTFSVEYQNNPHANGAEE